MTARRPQAGAGGRQPRSAEEVDRFLKHISAPELFDGISRPNPTVDPCGDLEDLVASVQRHAGGALVERIVPRS